ncbi:zf-UBR-domain-containing protein [Aureobasidium pullulans]|nr:zf-UBR-domain-containing protein [Aureobasidium pullulans]
MSQNTGASQTAQEFIASQLQLEADAREALPYQFDTCTKPLGPLRQAIFACLTCNPPPTSDNKSHTPAAVCYSCSISCHGEHELVELFTKRNFVCDCGTTRILSSPCTLRLNESTSQKGDVTGDTPAETNKYNHNFAGRFCACDDQYDPEKEKGTMFQCLGLGTVEDGGCGEDWWHPECLMGLPRPQPTETTPKEYKEETKQPIIEGQQETAQPTDVQEEVDEAPLPPGFPAEDDFDHLICYKCVNSFPWIKQYASQQGFLGPVYHKQPSESNEVKSEDKPTRDASLSSSETNKKRSAEDESEESASKKTKVETEGVIAETTTPSATTPAENTPPLHTKLPSAPTGTFSLFLREDFRNHFCRCPSCFPNLKSHSQLLEEEEAYEPPVSESDDEEAQNGRGSVGSGSTYERGEALLSNMDRVKAIEGVMVYNHLRDKVKTFLQPFAESGRPVGAEDIKAYFEKLRGDEEGIRLAGAGAGAADESQEGSQ